MDWQKRKRGRGLEHEGDRARERLDLHEGQSGFTGLLGLLAFADELADAAGVFAIEGLGEGVAQGGLLREADEHAGPRDGLEQNPVQSHREGHGEDDCKFGDALEQDGVFDDSRAARIQG